MTPLLDGKAADAEGSPAASPRSRWAWGWPTAPSAPAHPDAPRPALGGVAAPGGRAPALPDLLPCLRAGYDLPGFGPAPGEPAMTPAERRRHNAVRDVYAGIGSALAGAALIAGGALPLCTLHTLREPCAPAPPAPSVDADAFAARCWGPAPESSCPAGSHDLRWARRWCTQQLRAFMAAGAAGEFSATAESRGLTAWVCLTSLPLGVLIAGTSVVLSGEVGAWRGACAVRRDRLRRGVELAGLLGTALARDDAALVDTLLRLDAPTYLAPGPGRPSAVAFAQQHGSAAQRAAVEAAHRVQRGRLEANLRRSAVPAAASAELIALLSAGDVPAAAHHDPASA